MLRTIDYDSRRRRRRAHKGRWAIAAAFCLLACIAVDPAGAQSDRGTSFEVASVRLSDPEAVSSLRITNTRLDLTKYPLRQVLWLAFGIDPLQSDRLSAPDWARDLRVDIHATFPDGSRARIPDMLKTLLIERFGLRTSVGSRLTDVYELVVGPGGIRMQEVQAVNELDKKFQTNASLPGAASDRTLDEIGGPVRLTNTPRGLRTTTERSTFERIYATGRSGTWQLDATRIAMGDFARVLSANVGRPVFDRTQLAGVYQFSIELPLDVNMMPALAAKIAADPTGAATLRAVEQLGLRLEPRRIPMDTVVVDSISKVPTEN